MYDGLFNKPKGTFIPRNEICDENVGRKREIVRCIFSWVRITSRASSFFFFHPFLFFLSFFFSAERFPGQQRKKKKVEHSPLKSLIRNNSLDNELGRICDKGVNDSASLYVAGDKKFRTIFVRERII